MTSKGKDVSFANDDDWLNDLAFFVDITKHLSDLNVNLQGKDQLIHKMYEHILTQIQKLNLFQIQLLEGNCAHFVTLATRPPETVHHEKYAGLVECLRDEFL